MLILKRREGDATFVLKEDQEGSVESIQDNGHLVKVTIVSIDETTVRIGIDADKKYKIIREEILGMKDGAEACT